MIFSSLQYLLFLPLVTVLYWRTRGTTRLWLVILSSYVFYMSWLPIYGIFLLAMTSINWALGLSIAKARRSGSPLMKPLMVAGLLANLSCLCYYKYTNFFLSNLCAGINWFGIHFSLSGGPLLSWTMMNVILPLGISFFVFEFIHYLVDVYRGDEPIESWASFAAFAAFFPSQIAGPIKRFQNFMPYLRMPLPWSAELFNEAGALIMQGLFKKVAIADPLGSLIGASFAPHAVLGAPDAILASIGFVIQVYCDFSGYTDIGRGSALLLGIRLPQNFNLPFLAVDIAEFWRRWHMSLSLWLREYVYFPLGGSRAGKFASGRNLFVTMIACGLWHGAAWHYVIFGCVQGIGLIVRREWRDFLESVGWLDKLSKMFVAHWCGVIVTDLFVVSTFTIFRAPDMPTGLHVLSSWFGADMACTLWLPMVKSGVLWFSGIYLGFWLITEAVRKTRRLPKQESVMVYPSVLRFASWTAALFLMVAARPSAATPFVYFQF